MKHDILEADAVLLLKPRVLCVIPVEVIHEPSAEHKKCAIGAHRHRVSVCHSVPGVVPTLWLRGTMVTDVGIGDPGDPELTTAADVMRAVVLATVSECAVTVLAAAVIRLAW